MVQRREDAALGEGMPDLCVEQEDAVINKNVFVSPPSLT